MLKCIFACITQLRESLLCEWQSCLWMCLLQEEKSTSRQKTTVTDFKTAEAFNSQQQAPLPILTLRHFHSDVASQCHLEKPHSFAKNCWDPTLPHVQGNTYEVDQQYWNISNQTLQGSIAGGEKNFWVDWSSICTRISTQINSFSFTKADSTRQWELLLKYLFLCHNSPGLLFMASLPNLPQKLLHT